MLYLANPLLTSSIPHSSYDSALTSVLQSRTKSPVVFLFSFSRENENDDDGDDANARDSLLIASDHSCGPHFYTHSLTLVLVLGLKREYVGRIYPQLYY